MLLSSEEEQRAARFYFEQDRLRWARARSALRQVLSKELALEPLALEFTLGTHGKPSLRGGGIEFNLSHSGVWALIAISHSSLVGIDIERVRKTADIGRLLRRVGEEAPPEDSREALFQRWASREARTKATGTPLMETPADDVFSCDLEAPDGYAAAVALQGALPVAVYRGEV